MARRKVIITVAQTGAFHGKEANPNIPLTPEEIAASAYDCYNAGAALSTFTPGIKRACPPMIPRYTAPSARASGPGVMPFFSTLPPPQTGREPALRTA